MTNICTDRRLARARVKEVGWWEGAEKEEPKANSNIISTLFFSSFYNVFYAQPREFFFEFFSFLTSNSTPRARLTDVAIIRPSAVAARGRVPHLLFGLAAAPSYQAAAPGLGPFLLLLLLLIMELVLVTAVTGARGARRTGSSGDRRRVFRAP